MGMSTRGNAVDMSSSDVPAGMMDGRMRVRSYSSQVGRADCRGRLESHSAGQPDEPAGLRSSRRLED